MFKTISYKLAKELKDLGVKQESELYQLPDRIISYDLLDQYPTDLSAFMLDEILDMLPEISSYTLTVKRGNALQNKNLYYCLYRGTSGTGALYAEMHKNPAEAAGLLLKWCVENGHIKTGGKNER
jgi:hypothetical protein